MNFRRCLFACSTDAAFRGKDDKAAIARACRGAPKAPSPAALVALRERLFDKAPPRMVAATRRLRGTRDYAGAVEALVRHALRRKAAARRALALLGNVA